MHRQRRTLGAGRRARRERETNTGDRAGTVVAQPYVGFPASTREPPNQLKGFGKIAIKAGKRKLVKMLVDESSFSTFSTAEGRWTVGPGEYTLRIGTSSPDLPCSGRRQVAPKRRRFAHPCRKIDL